MDFNLFMNSLLEFVILGAVFALPALVISIVPFFIQRAASKSGRVYLKRASWMLATLAMMGIAAAWAYSYPWVESDYTRPRGTAWSILKTIVLAWVLVFIWIGHSFWSDRE